MFIIQLREGGGWKTMGRQQNTLLDAKKELFLLYETLKCNIKDLRIFNRKTQQSILPDLQNYNN